MYNQNPFLLIMYSIDIKLNCSKGKNLEIFNKGIRVTTNKKKRMNRGKKSRKSVQKNCQYVDNNMTFIDKVLPLAVFARTSANRTVAVVK